MSGCVVDLPAEHTRIEIPRSRVAADLFADRYRYGRLASPPLISYWGGAISPAVYEARRRTAPDRVRVEFEAALLERRGAVDLLVLSLPQAVARSRARLRADLHQVFCHELLPACGNLHPSSLGHVGYSAGAWVATSLAIDVDRSRAVATLAGVAMAEIVADASPESVARLHLSSYTNSDDPLTDETFWLRDVLALHGASLDLHIGPGGHDFHDYLENGFVRHAFADVLARVLPGIDTPPGLRA